MSSVQPSEVDPHQAIDIPDLLVKGGLARTRQEAIGAVCHGRVYIERWNIGVPEVRLPRWVLRGVKVTVGERSIVISEDGTKIRRVPSEQLSV